MRSIVRSEFTRSVKKDDHNDFVQLLKGAQSQWHVNSKPPRVLSSSRVPSSFQLSWIPSGDILMRVNLEDQAIAYFILLAPVSTICLQIYVSLFLNFCLKSQWRLCACKCVKPFFLHCDFYPFWGDYWSICSNVWWMYLLGKKWTSASRVQHSDMTQRKKSFWAVWELHLTFQRLQINIFYTVVITRTSNFSQGISCFYYACTFCFKTIHYWKAEPCTFHMALSTMCFHFPDIITIFNIHMWYTLILCTWMLFFSSQTSNLSSILL